MTSFPDAQALDTMAARLAPVDVGVDLLTLPEAERSALGHLVRVARVLDTLFLRQVWAGNETLLLDLLADTSDRGRARLRMFLINKGPWSRLDGGVAFVPGVPSKPPQGSFYPPGVTREAVEQWLAALPAEDRAVASGFFTTIRCDPEGRFVAVPYSLEYQPELGEAARLLREAARCTGEATLRRFLELRADAFEGNNYHASDVAWMQLDSIIEPTIGPYEVYEDEWFNAKAAFEAFIAVRDDAATRSLGAIGGQLQTIEDHLPIDPRHRNPAIGALVPIRVVNLVFASGDGNRGVQTAAFNLPNDERTIAATGSKSVLLRNVQQAKFRMVLEPIADLVLAPAERRHVAFDAFFTHILMHELMHGLGPHTITVDGRATTVRRELGARYSAIEEAKADVSGLFALQFLIDRGVLDQGLSATMYPTYLASMFRSLRFGIDEAHGRGVALQLNTFVDRGAVTHTADGRWGVNAARMRQVVIDLTGELMTLQALGSVPEAARWLDEVAVLRPAVGETLAGLHGIPVDIAPRFTILDDLSVRR